MNTLATTNLPDDIDQLKRIIIDAQDQLLHTSNNLNVTTDRLSSAEKRVRFLEEYVAALEERERLEKARKFAASSEKGVYQYGLFDEAEAATEADLDSDTDEDAIEIKAYHKRKRRLPLPDDLPTEEIVYALNDTEQQCDCGAVYTCIGEQIKEQIDIIPMQLKRIRHIQKKYVCRCCNSAPIVAPKPKQPIPKSIASPGFLAFVTTAKYVDSLPLYRLTKIFARQDIDIGRNTLANYMVQVGERLISPLMAAIQAHIRDYDIVNMDETPVQVLSEPGRKAQNKSYMWVMKGGPPQQQAVLYHYAPSRGQDVPTALLAGFQGYLQTDGYAGYNEIARKSGVTGLGCLAHARRKFVEAEKALPKGKGSAGKKISQFLKLIRELYRLEKHIYCKSIAERYRARQEEAKPILKKLHALAEQTAVLVPPSSKLGQAVSYLLSQWSRLIVYCEDGRLNIDNNTVENAIRPFAVGRKNWLFSQSQSGARASAALYSLVETAKLHGLDPYRYLRHVFERLPNLARDDSMDALLPWNCGTEIT